jgi:hypothetical protein
MAHLRCASFIVPTKRLQVPLVKCLPLAKLVVRLPEQMSQCVVVCYDKELRAPFKITPPMLPRLIYGQSLQIVHEVGVAALS